MYDFLLVTNSNFGGITFMADNCDVSQMMVILLIGSSFQCKLEICPDSRTTEMIVR